jgi:hypothetical protein
MTTSAETTKAEIARFLKGSEPGVFCITGEWGVGKTFLWRQVLDHLRKASGLSITRYSYVSLFGLNLACQPHQSGRFVAEGIVKHWLHPGELMVGGGTLNRLSDAFVVSLARDLLKSRCSNVAGYADDLTQLSGTPGSLGLKSDIARSPKNAKSRR